MNIIKQNSRLIGAMFVVVSLLLNCKGCDDNKNQYGGPWDFKVELLYENGDIDTMYFESVQDVRADVDDGAMYLVVQPFKKGHVTYHEPAVSNIRSYNILRKDKSYE